MLCVSILDSSGVSNGRMCHGAVCDSSSCGQPRWHAGPLIRAGSSVTSSNLTVSWKGTNVPTTSMQPDVATLSHWMPVPKRTALFFEGFSNHLCDLQADCIKAKISFSSCTATTCIMVVCINWYYSTISMSVWCSSEVNFYMFCDNSSHLSQSSVKSL